jgi:simple sugar transport system permease protein
MFDFFLTFIPRAIIQGTPLLYGSTGETLTEKSGNLNLGIPGIMYVGAISGVIGAFYYESSLPGPEPSAALWRWRLPSGQTSSDLC